MINFYVLEPFKYQLAKPVTFNSGLSPQGMMNGNDFIVCNNVRLYQFGTLRIDPGFRWDGASGPTMDTPSTFKASLVHDALYMLIREGHLRKSDRGRCDEILYYILVAEGMWKWRAKIWLWFIKLFGAYAVKRKKKLMDKRNLHRIREYNEERFV